jgi:RNA polymerase sigma factor (sigma-70 family)
MLPTDSNCPNACIRNALEKLYAGLLRLVPYIAWKIGRPEQAVEDALQNAIVLFLQRAEVEGQEEFLRASAGKQIGFFVTSMRNNTLKVKLRNRLDALPETPCEDEAALDPAEEMERKDTRRAVREAVQYLPKRQREMIELELLEFSTEETAQALNTSTTNVRVQQLRARRKLKEILQEQDLLP